MVIFRISISQVEPFIRRFFDDGWSLFREPLNELVIGKGKHVELYSAWYDNRAVDQVVFLKTGANPPYVEILVWARYSPDSPLAAHVIRTTEKVGGELYSAITIDPNAPRIDAIALDFFD